MKMLDQILGAMINAAVYIYMWSKLQDNKFDFKKISNYVYFLMIVIMMVLNFHYVDKNLRILVISIFFCFANYLINKEKVNKTILSVVFSQLIIIVAETITAIVVLNILKIDIDQIINNLLGSFLMNVIISLITFLLIQITLFKKIYDKILNRINTNKTKTFVIFMLIVLTSMNIMFSMVYYKLQPIYMITINILLFGVYFIVVIRLLAEKSTNYKMNEKYNTSLTNLKEYEEMLDQYRISNHENKNQLLIIRNMVIKKEKNVPTYIDKLIDNKLKDDEKLMFELNVIPPGGVRAVIYSKMLVMKDKNITHILKVGRFVRGISIMDMDDNIVLEMCKIMGVFLDNSIEAVENLKERNILIELRIEDKDLVIEISNNFQGTVDLEELTKSGYTTKGKNHGYGMCLVKEIVGANSRFINETKIENEIFIQKLIVKMVNKKNVAK